jgi:hypothetical protein
VLLALPLALYASSSFLGIGKPYVFLRYQAALVPFALALAVAGIGGLVDRAARGGSRRLAASRALAVAAVALQALCGPLLDALPPRSLLGYRYALFPSEFQSRQPLNLKAVLVPSSGELDAAQELPRSLTGADLPELARSGATRRIVRIASGEEPVGFRMRTLALGARGLQRLAGAPFLALWPGPPAAAAPAEWPARTPRPSADA